MLRQTLLLVALTACSNVAAAATLKPIDVAGFFVTPDQPAVLRWNVEGTLAGPVEAIVHDYADRPVATTPAKLAPDGAVELTVRLSPGFYEVELPAAGQRFGVMSIAAHEGKADPFFSIDAAMSWLVRGDDAVREGLVKVLARSGVAMSRERLNWARISPAPGRWDWESPDRYESLRRAYAEHGVEVLEMFHGTTRWAGSVERYPDDLVGTARAWREIGRRWRPLWGAMEVWNEPDILFGGNLPADQYVPLVRTLAYAFDEEKIGVPIVGGVFAHYDPAYLDNAARNGLLDLVDVVSFHTYGRAPGMERLIENYRSWLAAHGREAMPLWITECGRPWRKGPDRPPADQDAESALDITMKAVESRACGIARYFAFVYPFYGEGDNNFGMMGRRGTPLRSMAAYAQMAAVLAHKGYLGDLQCSDEAVQRARVFGDDRETVAVLYTASTKADAKVKLGLPVMRVAGIDGRALDVSEEGAVPVPDGLAYVWLDPHQLGDRLRRDTPAMRLRSIALQNPPQRQTPPPIVLRYQFDKAHVEASSKGYRVRAEKPGKTPLAVRVFNLSQEPWDLKLTLELSQPAARVVGPATQAVSVPGEQSADAAWEVDWPAHSSANDRVVASVEATGRAGEKVTSLRIDLF
jgi:hypothetical protein